MNAMQSKITLREMEKVREYYVERSALFGILRWKEITKTESIGKILSIHNEGESIDDIYLNGKKLIIKNLNH